MMIEIISIIIFNIFIYWRTIWYGLVMDDCQWHASRQEDSMPFHKIRNLYQLKKFINNRFYSGTTFGTNTKVEHSVTIFLHTTICVLMYWAFGHNQISFWAAMLYACNPINNQTSIWLNGRRYAVNIILVLLMILIPAMAGIFYFATGLFQVTAFFAPILLMKYSPWMIILIPIFFGIGWNHIKGKIRSRTDLMAAGDLKIFKPTRLIMVVKTFGFYFWKMIIPGVCSMQYPDRFNWGRTKSGNQEAYAIDWAFWQGAMAMVILLVAIALLPKENAFWGIFFGLSLLQWSSVLPVTQILSDRYCSLPNVFMMLFVSYFSSFMGILYIPAMVILIGYYLICLFVVMPMYKDIMAWYNYHLQYFPGIPWPRTLLISDLMAEGKHEGAQYYIAEGLKYNQTDYSLLMWASILHITRGDFKNSLIMLDEAEKNFYLGQEKKQAEEVKGLRTQIKNVMPKRKGFR